MNFLLDIVPGTGDKAGGWYFTDKAEALIYAGLGFLIVFAGIVIIIAIIWLIGLLMRKTDGLAFITDRKKREKPAEAVSAETVPETEEELSDEVTAAIVAAISAYYGSTEKVKPDFKVKRIKRIQGEKKNA